jgi:PBP1b-binding outer membrane lipoprotein LpoB
MKAILFALFIALLMVGCEQEGQSVGSDGEVEDKPFLPSLPSFNLNES